jgi:tetratricopeptide (TPR) repeat protein
MKRLAFSTLLAAAAAVGALSVFARQEIDPFYLKSLREGEALFQAGRYGEAARSFEMAAFGLFQRKDALARSRVFLWLCYARLNDRPKAEQNLRSALTILGPEGLAALEIPEGAKADLARALKNLKIEAFPAPSAGAPPRTVPLPETPPRGADRDKTLASLAESIRLQPRESGPYYEMGRLLADSGDYAAAETVYKNLLAANPAEIRGYLEWGKLAFRRRDWKNAEKRAEMFLKLSADVAADPRLLPEARAYLALAAAQRGDMNKAEAALRASPELADPAAAAALGLLGEDRERLASILRRVFK